MIYYYLCSRKHEEREEMMEDREKANFSEVLEVLRNMMGAIANPGADREDAMRDEVNGLVVSTVFTTDIGWETAILDVNHAYLVECYDSKEKAQQGHGYWTVRAETIITITALGYKGLTPNREITLERGYEDV